MSLIYHITRKKTWEQARPNRIYRGDTLSSEGFIHCSTRAQVIPTANAYFPGQRGLVLLEIDEAAVKAEIRYEGVGGGQMFPHIYGPLNIDAVVRLLPFDAEADGGFLFPESDR